MSKDINISSEDLKAFKDNLKTLVEMYKRDYYKDTSNDVNQAYYYAYDNIVRLARVYLGGFD